MNTRFALIQASGSPDSIDKLYNQGLFLWQKS
jgi:hypothetical protein